MRTHILLLCLLFTLSVGRAQVDSLLFVGNSYTYGNNMPALFQDLATAAGDSFYVESISAGGYTLQDHLNNPTHINKIIQRHWDYFIVQEQSQVPTIDYYYNTITLPTIPVLDSYFKLNNSCSKTYYFMTWGRRYGGQQCDPPATHCSVHFADFDEMQDTLKSRYLGMAATVDASVSPVGEAWRLALQDTVGLVLHTSDNSHANLRGSYLAACTHYASLTGKSPVGIPYTAGLNSAWANYLQRKAKEAVLDSFAVYNIDTAASLPFQLALGGTVHTSDFSCASDSIQLMVHFDYAGQNPADSLLYQLSTYDATAALLERDSYQLDLLEHCHPVNSSELRRIAVSRESRYLLVEASYQDASGLVALRDTLAAFPFPTDLVDATTVFREEFSSENYLSSADFWRAEYDFFQGTGWSLKVDAAALLQQVPESPAGCALLRLPPNATPKRLATPCLTLYDTMAYEIRFRHTNHRNDSLNQLGFRLSLSDTSSFDTEHILKDMGLRYDSVYRLFRDTFTVVQSGNYFLGIQAYAAASNTGLGFLAIDDFELRALQGSSPTVALSEAPTAVSELRLYPNPASHYFRLEQQPDLINQSDLSIRIYDVYGRDWTQHIQRIDAGGYYFDLAMGTYLVVLQHRGQPIAQQLLVVAGD